MKLTRECAMKTFSKILLLFVTFFLFAQVALASVTFTILSPSLPFEDDPAFNLCDVTCDVTILFPEGGTLSATDILLFEFANGGELELGEGGSFNMSVQPASLDFSAGGTLFLTVGESITFGLGGYVKTASGGNLKYSEIAVTTDVSIDAVLDTVGTAVNLFDITATGSGDITISSNGVINVVGELASSEAGFNLNGVVIDTLPRLCNSSCDLTIVFPDGGTLTATEALRVYFGVGGFIDLGDTGTVNASAQPDTLVFPDGGSLVLDPGESITFDVGGSIRTAPGGNLAYTRVAVTTDVSIDAVLDEGSESVDLLDLTVDGSGTVTVSVDGIINLNGSISAGDANLLFDSVSAITIKDSTGATTAECSSTSNDGTVVTLSSTSSLVSPGTSCVGSISVGGVTGGIINLSESATIAVNTDVTIAEVEAEAENLERSKDDGLGQIDLLTLAVLLAIVIIFYRRNSSIR